MKITLGGVLKGVAVIAGAAVVATGIAFGLNQIDSIEGSKWTQWASDAVNAVIGAFQDKSDYAIAGGAAVAGGVTAGYFAEKVGEQRGAKKGFAQAVSMNEAGLLQR